MGDSKRHRGCMVPSTLTITSESEILEKQEESVSHNLLPSRKHIVFSSERSSQHAKWLSHRMERGFYWPTEGCPNQP